MNFIKFLLKTSKWNLVFSIAVGVLAGISSAGMIALINMKLQTETWGFDKLVIGFILLWIGYGVFSILTEFLLIRLSQKALYNLRLTLSQQILFTPLKSFETAGSHRFLVTLTEDLNNLARTVVSLPGAFISSATILGCYAYMLWLSPSLSLISVGFVILVYPISRLPISSASKWIEELRIGWDQLYEHFTSLTGGIKEFLLNNVKKRKFLSDKLSPSFVDLKDQAVKGLTMLKSFHRISELVGLMILGCIIFGFSGYLEISNDVLRGFVLAALFIITPINKLIEFFPSLIQSNVSLAQMEKLGLEPFKDPDSQTMQAVNPLPYQTDGPNLVIKDVAYTYYNVDKDDEFSLGPLSLSFNTGDVTFLVGGNGSGKTTLVKLLCGLYTPEKGQVFWNGTNITEDNLEQYRQNFSVIFSDYFLFDSLFWLESSGIDQKVKDYLVKLHLSQKVSIDNGKFSSVNLSQGQRKRLALLSSYLEDRHFYIFDEWAADQDPVFKKIFYNEILRELKNQNKTILVVSHDDSYFHLADHIIKLDEGKITIDKTKAGAMGLDSGL